MAENTNLLEEDLIVDIEEAPPSPIAEYVEPSEFLIPPSDREPLDPNAPLSPDEEEDYLRSLMRVDKIDIDYDEMIKIPHPEEARTLNDDDIAKYLIETRFSDRFKEGDYQLFRNEGYSPNTLSNNLLTSALSGLTLLLWKKLEKQQYQCPVPSWGLQ